MFGDARLPERFWERVIPEPNSGCWLWLAAKGTDGSGSFWDAPNKRQDAAHRMTYRLMVGAISPGRFLMPRCGMPECCNPWHRDVSRPLTPSEKRAQARGYYLKNPQKSIAATRRWMANNRERHLKNKSAWERKKRAADPLRSRALHLRHRYGITLEDQQRMLTEQHGKCAICDVELTKRFHVDHDHSSGRVRGILCFGCNAGLGQFRENIDALSNAISYLKERG